MVAHLLVKSGIHKPGAIMLFVTLHIAGPGPTGFTFIQIVLLCIGKQHAKVIGTE